MIIKDNNNKQPPPVESIIIKSGLFPVSLSLSNHKILRPYGVIDMWFHPVPFLIPLCRASVAH